MSEKAPLPEKKEEINPDNDHTPNEWRETLRKLIEKEYN